MSVNVPALYIGQSDYVLTVSDDVAEVFNVTASRDGKPIVTGHGFRGPQIGTDPRDDTPQAFAAMFGAFVGHYAETLDDPDGWTVHDPEADLDELSDACSTYAEECPECSGDPNLCPCDGKDG